MAYCTNCGTLMNEADMKTHVCNSSDVPDIGKPIRQGTTKATTV